MRFGIVLPRIFETGPCLALVLLLYPGYALCHAEQPPQTQYARDILNRAGRDGVALKMVAGLGHREAFRVVTGGDRQRVEATSPAGLIYGAQAVVSDDVQAGHVQRPDFDIRGTTLWLGGAVQGRRIAPYHSGFNSDTLPWFFDRPLMTRYLDRLASARFNTLLLWATDGWPFAREARQGRLACVPDSQVERLEGGHHLHVENTAVVAPLIRRFLGL